MEFTMCSTLTSWLVYVNTTLGPRVLSRVYLVLSFMFAMENELHLCFFAKLSESHLGNTNDHSK